MYYNKKLGIIESIYDPCFFYRSSLLETMEIETNDKLILADNNFAYNREKTIKVIKIMTKDCKYLIFAQLIKFNGAQIKLELNDIVLAKKSYVDDIFLITGNNVDSTS